ncbi:MAG: hypothetical protein JRG84_09330 [Deltaproteobacteria bacterium]|nr:hypothetical protein [Deltaproteobacteria bacterium]
MFVLSPVRALGLLLTLGLLVGCASTGLGGSGDVQFGFFNPTSTDTDPWVAKVADWQRRERRDRPHTALADAETLRAKRRSALLRVKMGHWEADERLSLAKRITLWTQAVARRHYRFDPPTDAASDPWPTTKDLLDRNGDDCDGLDLIAYELLRQFGFPPDELYRAIVKRKRDGANHMVTLWFERSDDPWVIDATGAVSLRVRHFSALPGWTPTALFNEHDQFTPRRLSELARAAER